MCGLHSISIGHSHGDAVISGEFDGAGFVQANSVARATRVYNGSADVGWFEGRN